MLDLAGVQIQILLPLPAYHNTICVAGSSCGCMNSGKWWTDRLSVWVKLNVAMDC